MNDAENLYIAVRVPQVVNPFFTVTDIGFGIQIDGDHDDVQSRVTIWSP